jgi:hypothetical protein
MTEHAGILGALFEAIDIQNDLEIPFEDALDVQRKLEADRVREYEREQAEEASNVLQFRPRGH